MKKKNKKNEKGFVLVETLVVTVFVAAIFSIIFLNFYPLIGEYERRENYDDVDSKYAAYWVKKMLQESDYNILYPGSGTPLNGHVCVSYRDITCDKLFSDDAKRQTCNNLQKSLGISKIIATTYDLSMIKEGLDGGCSEAFTAFSQGFKEYIDYLPKYTAGSLNNAKYRILVEIKHDRPYSDSTLEQEDITEYPYYTYATLEVIK